MAILFILVFVLPVISTQGEAASPTFTATRNIISPDDITPGSTFKVRVTLNVTQNESDLTLDEVIPTDWTVVSADSAGAIFSASDLKWIWPSVSAGETKSISYDVTVHSNSTEKSYPISGKISANNATATDVGGELTVAVKTPSRKIPPWGIVMVMLVVILFAFFLILFIGWSDDHKLDKGEMRRAIAGTFVLGFSVLALLSIIYEFELSKIVLMYIELTGSVVGFYFGARTAAEKRAEAVAEITIENVRFPAKEVAITVRNGGDSKITVDTIYINTEAFKLDRKIKIDPQKSKEIVQAYEWIPKIEYKIKIATTTGLIAETTELSPAIIIDQVDFDPATPKKIILTVKNGGDSEIEVDKIHINNEIFKLDSKIKINPQTSGKIEKDYEWNYKAEYKIKIATTTGLIAETTASSPKEKPAELEK